MLRVFACILLILVGSCASRMDPRPSDIRNACVIKSEQPDWIAAARSAEAKWGVPVPVQLATIWRESRFVSDARTPKKYRFGFIPAGRISSAYGFSQALDGTWEEYQRESGNRRGRRDRMSDATDFIGWYMTLTKRRNGVELTNAYHQYLAYHEGHTGYRRGSYRNKAFLLRAAKEVETQAVQYQIQLASCGG